MNLANAEQLPKSTNRSLPSTIDSYLGPNAWPKASDQMAAALKSTPNMFFSELILRTDSDRRSFETHPVIVDAIARGLSKERYRHLLLELYHVVWHFNPISAAATSRLSDDYRQVRYFLYEHMQEEKGHELWVLNDLNALGVTHKEVEGYHVSPYNLALNGYNYWAADRAHPCSVLGMLYCLEVIASVYGGPFASAIKESLFLDGDEGVSFISSHATMDDKHMADLRVVLNTIECTLARQAIIESAVVNFHHFTQILAAI